MLHILRRRKWWVVSMTVLGLAVSLAFSLTAHKQYSATAQLLVQPSVSRERRSAPSSSRSPRPRCRPSCSWSPAPRCSRRCAARLQQHARGVGLAGGPDERDRHHGHQPGAVPGGPSSRTSTRPRSCSTARRWRNRNLASAEAQLRSQISALGKRTQALQVRHDLAGGVCAAQPAGRAEGTAGPDGGQRRGQHRRRGAGHARAGAGLAEFAQARPGRPARPGRRARPRPRRGLPARQPG